MKFPRNSKLLRNPFDAAPFAAVFFLLAIFLVLGALRPTPGVPLQLPEAADLPGTDKPTVAMAVDQSNCYYLADQIVSSVTLSNGLRAAAQGSAEPLTLVIHADKRVTYEELVQITLLARGAGITNALLATLPADSGTPGKKP